MAESMAQFVARRMRERSQFGGAAEAAAHEAYGRAIRAGKELSLPTARDVTDYGAALLRRAVKPVTNQRNSAPTNAKLTRSPPPVSNSRTPTRTIDAGTVAKRFAGDTAEFAGNIVGVGRGAVHAGEGLWDGTVFTGRLMGGDRQAWEQVERATRTGAGYVKRAVADPEVVVRDVVAKAHQMRGELDPYATPEAATFGGEMRRRFDIGQNQGELVFDVGSAVVGGPAAKTVGRLATAVKPARAEKFLAQGYTPAAAGRLAEPYTGLGHHYIPNRSPVRLGRNYRDGPFNTLRPEGISIGDMYELHAKVDPTFWGATLLPGEPWRAKVAGVQKYDQAGRIWHGAPGPLKARVGGLGATGGGVAYDLSAQDETW